MASTYIDVHILQTVPFANLNRDDLNQPKTLTYGGGVRTRVSSQCWKRAVRMRMQTELGQAAVRTRRIAAEVAGHLMRRGWPADLAQHAGAQVVASAAADLGLKVEDDGETSVLLYLTDTAFAELADVCEAYREQLVATLGAEAAGGKGSGKGKKKEAPPKVLPADEVNQIIASRNGVISLFGRMLAELPAAKVDGAVQVAHAFTTHDAEPEIDFFTAVDDLTHLAEDQGSAHMGDAELSAGVFYRYASVNLGDLLANLNGDSDTARDLVTAFVNAFISSLPEAKKNSTAPFSVPDLVYVSVRGDRPVSLAAAFEKPVRWANDGGCAEPSRRALEEYAGQVNRLIGRDGILADAHAGIGDKPLAALGTAVPSFREVVDRAMTAAFDGRS